MWYSQVRLEKASINFNPHENPVLFTGTKWAQSLNTKEIYPSATAWDQSCTSMWLDIASPKYVSYYEILFLSKICRTLE